MAKDTKKNYKIKQTGSLKKINNVFNNIIDNISFGTYKVDTKREKELQIINDEINKVISTEINKITNITGDDISTYFVKLFNEQDIRLTRDVKDIQDIFASDNQGIFEFFKERYRNQNLMYEDLSMICTQLFELQEAVNATRDAIVTSDDLSQTVSRTLKFKNIHDQSKVEEYIKKVEELEKVNKLSYKIKNHVIPKTLIFGKYYVYTVPYSKLFEQHMNVKNKQLKKDSGLGYTLESYSDSVIQSLKDNKMSSTSTEANMKKQIQSVLENIEVYNDETSIPILENVDLTGLLESDFFNDEAFKNEVTKSVKNVESKNKKDSSIYSDGVVNKKDKNADFSNIKECYIKLIDPRKMIPIKILDKVIGYYYIHDTDVQFTRQPFTTAIKFTTDNYNDPKKVENTVLSKITDQIVKSFNKKYLENNIKFKDLILNALMYHDIYKKNLKFQFIPADYITEYSVNEDEDGNGTSILAGALFYAKLYLAILIFKIVSILSKSNDTKIYYVQSSGIDMDIVNKVQEVAREIKQKQINFMDLLNYNSMVSKIGAAKDIFMPVGRSGEQSIKFDVLQGQDVQLNTELTDMLKSSFINATGVPSVIMNYINEADYAKTLVMANAKFQGRVVQYQLDINEGNTEVYKKIMKFSTDIPEEAINDFEYAYSAPKSLNNMNMSDVISNGEQSINVMVKALTGENSNPEEDMNRIKDLLYKDLSKEMYPMLPWRQAEEIFKNIQVKIEQEKAHKKGSENNSENSI
jgi:hypothetical protein